MLKKLKNNINCHIFNKHLWIDDYNFKMRKCKNCEIIQVKLKLKYLGGEFKWHSINKKSCWLIKQLRLFCTPIRRN